jgi:hypothetical protein
VDFYIKKGINIIINGKSSMQRFICKKCICKKLIVEAEEQSCNCHVDCDCENDWFPTHTFIHDINLNSEIEPISLKILKESIQNSENSIKNSENAIKSSESSIRNSENSIRNTKYYIKHLNNEIHSDNSADTILEKE